MDYRVPVDQDSVSMHPLFFNEIQVIVQNIGINGMDILEITGIREERRLQDTNFHSKIQARPCVWRGVCGSF